MFRHLKPGTAEAEVRHLLGPPDAVHANQWIYYLDRHAGWRIRFDSKGAVKGVDDWES